MSGSPRADPDLEPATPWPPPEWPVEARTVPDEGVGEDRRVLHGATLVGPVLVAEREPERDGLRGDCAP